MALKTASFTLVVILSFVAGFASESNKADPIKVAVLDTGKSWHNNVDLCGSIDLIGESVEDKHGHGTNVSYLINKHAQGTPHCQLPIKVFEVSNDEVKRAETFSGFKMAVAYGVDMINYSAGGVKKGEPECAIVKLALDRGIKIVASAGNEGKDLEEQPYYPANCDDRVIVVGCKNFKDSNYGKKVDYTYKCQNVGKPAKSGTSQAAAIASGKLVKKLYKERVHESGKNR